MNIIANTVGNFIYLSSFKYGLNNKLPELYYLERQPVQEKKTEIKPTLISGYLRGIKIGTQQADGWRNSVTFLQLLELRCYQTALFFSFRLYQQRREADPDRKVAQDLQIFYSCLQRSALHHLFQKRTQKRNGRKINFFLAYHLFSSIANARVHMAGYKSTP